MPRSMVKKATVTHIWDDESEIDVDLYGGSDESLGKFVSISVGANVVKIWLDSWNEIRDQIDGIFNEISS